MKLRMFALIGLLTGTTAAFVINHTKTANQQLSQEHAQLMMIAEGTGKPQPGLLPADAMQEPGYLGEPGSIRPDIRFKQGVTAPPPLPKAVLVLRRTSEKVKDTNDPIWQLELVSEGKVLDKLPALSGRSYRQNHDRNVSGNKSPLPRGMYRIDRRGIEAGPFSDPELGSGYWVPITPMFTTGRSDLGFHVDPSWGKRNGESGTSGCIGLPNRDATVRLVDWIRSFGVTQLEVVS